MATARGSDLRGFSWPSTGHRREHSFPNLNMGGSHQTSGEITNYCFEFI
jgi:hypothetical protein